MKKETSTHVYSCSFGGIFINFSSEKLLISMKGIKISYIVQSPVNMKIQ